MNVLYGHGGAKWIDYKLVKKFVDPCTYIYSADITNNNLNQDKMWTTWDAY
jgi:hypothetical protein